VIPIGEFFIGPFTTALAADELLVEIRLPRFPDGAGWAFEEVARRRGDFAMVAVTAIVQIHSDGTLADARLAYLSMGPTPIRARATEAWLQGQPGNPDSFARAAEDAVGELEPADDIHASREYRQHVSKALTRRALARALERARSQ
jgi:carbon-monoxide dehydrogenase medium subunit